MAQLDLSYHFDSNLQEVLTSPADARQHIAALIIEASTSGDPTTQVLAWGKAGMFLRMLRQYAQAEELLNKAIRLCITHALPLNLKMSQELRLAQVYQWQRQFEKSNALYERLLREVQLNENAGDMLDFIWQHAGKNWFDQAAYREATLAFRSALDLRRKRAAPEDQLQSSEVALRAAASRLKAIS